MVSNVLIAVLSVVITAAVIGGYTVFQQDITFGGVNKPPVVSIQPISNVTVNQTVLINATISDPDGTITTTIWDQKTGPKSNFTQVGEDIYFTPLFNGSYLFTVEAQDNDNAITQTGYLINVQSAPVPEPIPVPPKPTCTSEQVYNATTNKCDPKPVPVPPKPTCNADQVYNATTNKCDPKPIVTPPPAPVEGDMKIAVVGDVDSTTAGTATYNQIKAQNPTNVFVLGDLGYDDNLSWFKKTYGLFGNKVNCVLGNHESSKEDGSTSIEAEALQYCKNNFYIKQNHVLFLFFNTNGDLAKQTAASNVLTSNTQFMTGITSLHIVSHKPCAVPPNAHHPVEPTIKTFCDAVKSKIPATVKVYYDQAHNHVMSQSKDGLYKQIGSGGRSHYTCGTNTDFPWCNNVNYGFLQYTIKPDGTTTWQWIDYNGRVLK